MKRLFILMSMIFTENLCKTEVIDYNESHKDAVMEIAFQDPIKFLPGLSFLKRTQPAIFESVIDASKKEVETSLTDPMRITKILIDSDSKKVLGLVVYLRERELSLESMKHLCESQGMPFDENQFSFLYPKMKKFNSECIEFAKIESLAISNTVRGKGYGRRLLNEAINNIEQNWRDISRIELNVSQDNEAAINLYKSEGFKKSDDQPMMITIMEAVQYTKEIK